MEDVYVKLDDEQLEIINQVSELSLVNYGIKEDLISVDSLICVIKDLKLELTNLQEKIEKYEENYRPITNRELWGDYDDFIRDGGHID